MRSLIRKLALRLARRMGPTHRSRPERRAAGHSAQGERQAPPAPWNEPPQGTAAALRFRAAEARARAAAYYERADAWSLAGQRWKAETRCAGAQDALREAEFLDGQADALVRHQLEIVQRMGARWARVEVLHPPPPQTCPPPKPRRKRRASRARRRA